MANAKPVTRAKIHVKKGDTVVVVTGKSAGKRGKVLEVIPKENRVVVEGVNVVKKHTRPTQKMPQGGIIEKEAPVASSNVMIFCPKCNAPRRINKEIQGSDNKVRVCNKCGESFDK